MYGLGAGMKQEGRPMVWETHEVREEMNYSRFVSLPLLPLLLLTSKTRATHLHTHTTPGSPTMPMLTQP